MIKKGQQQEDTEINTKQQKAQESTRKHKKGNLCTPVCTPLGFSTNIKKSGVHTFGLITWH